MYKNMKYLSPYDVSFLAKAAFLGSGGGGGIQKMEKLLRQLNRSQRIIQMEDWDDDGLILGVECIDAPNPDAPMIDELNVLPMLDLVKKDFNQSVQALLAVEIGGANSLVQFILAKDLPVVAGDL